MKNLTFSILFILLSLSSSSQDLSGTYTDGENRITFNNGSVEFSLMGEFHSSIDIGTKHCFREYLTKGKGTYFRIDNFLIIDTEEEDKKEQNFSISESKNNTSFLNVSDLKTNEQVPFYNLYLLDNKGNIIQRVTGDISGKTIIPQNKGAKEIEISFIGYQKHISKYMLGYDYNIKIQEKQFMGASRVVFKINKTSNNNLNLSHLSWDFHLRNDMKKELIELNENRSKIEFKLQKAN